MLCPACGAQNRDGARFCGDCGSPLAARCSACDAELAPGARFCDRCGTPATPPSEAHELRKTVTIVFADVVGSTSLHERLDAESVRRVMTRFYETARAAVEAHEGSVVKFTGDGVMAAFGAPVVREDDALRAVRAAVALGDGVRTLNDELDRRWGVQLVLRTGVNTGEVVVGARDGDLVGDTVNLAARLEQAAGEGEVLLGEETQRLVRHRVSLEPVGALDLKGKASPVDAHRLVAATPPPHDAGAADAPLIGRYDDLRHLRAAFDRAVGDRACRLVTVVGSPGIGKSRLADEFTASLERDATVLAGRCEASDGGITFAPVIEVLRSAAGIGEADDGASAREKLTTLLPGSADRDMVVERALGVLGAVPAASTEETFWGVRRVLEGLARARPLVVVLDDIHWGQPTFLDLVEHLVEWVRDAPLLLLALARPELRELRDALASRRRAADVIELDPLDPADSRTLVDELLGQAELPDGLAARVLEATEGNPLFVAETVRMLIDEGVLRRTGDTWVVAGERTGIVVPPTIQALIAARLERLLDDERAVVERASVIGKQFYKGAVAHLCDPPVRLRIDSHLDTLRRKELVESEGTYWIDEPVFRFHHVLIRDAAYRSLLKEARAELHERFAAWLESKAGEVVGEHEEVVAFHLEQAHEYRRQLGPLDEPGRRLGARAAERLGSAGRRALARDDLPAAANLLARALERLDAEAPEQAALLADLAEARLSAGDTHAAEPVVARLQAAAHDARLRALAAVYAAQLASLTDSSQLHETVASVTAQADTLAELGDDAGVAKAMHVRAAALAQLGQVGAAEGALDRALASARAAGDARRERAVLAGAPLAALWGPSPVVRASGRCLDVVRILRMTPGNRHLEAAALSCQGVLEAMRGRADAARSMLDASRATLEELGAGLELLETDVHAGLVELLDGDAAGAEAHLRSAYEGFAELGAATGRDRAAALLARALLEQGRDDEADELTRISHEQRGEDLKATIGWCGARATVLSRRGEHEEAVRLAREGADMAAQTDALTDHADARTALAAVLHAAGRADEAGQETRRALELYGAKGNAAGAQRAQAWSAVEPPSGSAAPRRSAITEDGAGPAGARASRHGANARRPDRAAGPGTARSLIDQHERAINTRDDEALLGVYTADMRMIDRRPIGWGVLEGGRAVVDVLNGAVALSPDFHLVNEPVAIGLATGVQRQRWRGHMVDGGGWFELDMLTIMRARDGAIDLVEIFEESDAPAALARFVEIGAASQPERVGARIVGCIRAGDWGALRGWVAPDASGADHRAAARARLDGADAVAGWWRSWAAGGSDLEAWFEVLAGDDEHVAARCGVHGRRADGGAVDHAVTIAASVRDGRLAGWDVYDGRDDASALLRVRELQSASSTSAQPR